MDVGYRFNPRPLWRGDKEKLRHDDTYKVSTHAPVKMRRALQATLLFLAAVSTHAPVKVRPVKVNILLEDGQFQPTHP